MASHKSPGENNSQLWNFQKIDTPTLNSLNKDSMLSDETNLPYLIQTPLGKWNAWIESLSFTFIFLGVGFLIDHSDPFLLNSQFTWLILPPLLISLQYGFRSGISIAGLIIGILGLGWYFQWHLLAVFPATIVAGILLVTMIASEYRERWARRVHLLAQDYHYQKLRMEGFTRIYQVLKRSHNHLERQLCSQSKSLRTSLLHLEKQMITLEQKDAEPLDDIGDSILRIFSEHASIYAASLYSVNKQTLWKLTPVASIGEPASIQRSNVLIKTVLKTRSVASVQSHLKQTDNALVVIPLVDVFNRIWGVVVITEMPLFALHSNALDLLAVIGGRMGDLLNRRVELKPSADLWKQLKFVLLRMLIEVNKHQNSAVITAINFTSTTLNQRLITKLFSESRALDKIWVYENPLGHQVVIHLLPLTDGKAIEGFLQRLRRLVPVNSKNSVDDDKLNVHQWVLEADTSADKVLSELYDHCQTV